MHPRVHFANTENADMYYLVGTRIPDPFFFLDIGKKIVILNALEIDAFREHAEGSIEAVPQEPLFVEAKKIEGKESGLCKLALVIWKKYGLLEREVYVARSFPLDVADFLRSRGAILSVQHPFLGERATKSAQEISFIRENLRATKIAFEFIEEVLLRAEIQDERLIFRSRELTSEFLKQEAMKILFERGLDDVEGMIISSGSQAAMPHHKGHSSIKANTPIICDLFFRNRHNRYFGDMTRTYVKGVPTEALRRMYEAVSKAQDAAFAAIRPSVPAKDIFEASAAPIRALGFDVGEKGYIHGLGHGLGLELHEAPNVSLHSKDVLEVGHVFTVEPGLYYPEPGGVRIEDVVVVTEDGFGNLTDYHREWIIS